MSKGWLPLLPRCRLAAMRWGRLGLDGADPERARGHGLWCTASGGRLRAMALTVGLWLGSGASHAQAPAFEELVQAARAMQPWAQAQGLQLRVGPLWLTALRMRAPLVAAYASNGECWLGYTSYTPGRDYSWLFPTLPAPQRSRWLQGIVAHELAHCALSARTVAARGSGSDEATAPLQAVAEGVQASARTEALADLAFALYLDTGADGDALMRQLAAVRAGQRQRDPAHDSSDALACYLAQPDRAAPLGDWLARLDTLRQRCLR